MARGRRELQSFQPRSISKPTENKPALTGTNSFINRLHPVILIIGPAGWRGVKIQGDQMEHIVNLF